jgi:hypothetical protein
MQRDTKRREVRFFHDDEGRTRYDRRLEPNRLSRSGRDGDKRCQYEGGVHHRSRFELLTEIVSPGHQSDTNSSTSTTLAIWLSSFIDS